MFGESLSGTSRLLEHLPYAGLFVLLILGTLGLPIPEDAILILAGVLVAQGAVKLPIVLAVLYAGLLVTDYALYAAGRKFGRRIVRHRRFRRVISRRTLGRLEGAFQKWRFWVLLGGRNVIGLRAQLFLAAGAFGIPPSRFLAADAAAALVSIATWVAVGYFGARGATALGVKAKQLQWAFTILFVLLLVGAAVLLVWRRRHPMKDEEDGDADAAEGAKEDRRAS